MRDLIWKPTGERLVWHGGLQAWDTPGHVVRVQQSVNSGNGVAWLVVGGMDMASGASPQAALDVLADRLREQHAALGKVLGVRSADVERAAVVALGRWRATDAQERGERADRSDSATADKLFAGASALASFVRAIERGKHINGRGGEHG